MGARPGDSRLRFFAHVRVTGRAPRPLVSLRRRWFVSTIFLFLSLTHTRLALIQLREELGNQHREITFHTSNFVNAQTIAVSCSLRTNLMKDLNPAFFFSYEIRSWVGLKACKWSSCSQMHPARPSVALDQLNPCIYVLYIHLKVGI